ncbi:hypothetical protein ATK17_1962 [Branchiibius hedensis]|uniref:Uncharacterized protein n=1 Tax=Branchiibius hedensis TaxID=672460 RepID=A0A2Y8ZXN2_9MICO|nr:hypothetical protein [Branchiibius hedensis]PWJ25824.1 hypothetical protein ATK17_1962 [Branchiibius hedensis]SSA34637.1 hypothetical protein SAMN04489750_1962 [Branchiibius hedensis]
MSSGVASAATAPKPITSGNFEYTAPQYYCNGQVPAVAGYFRTLRHAEKAVTLTLPGVGSKTLGAAKPYEPGVYAAAGMKGADGALVVSGSSTGSKFTVQIHLPTSCAGLPTTRPAPPAWVVAKPTGSSSPTSSTHPTSGPPVVTDGPMTPATDGSNEQVLIAGGVLAAGALVTGVGLRRRLKRQG